MKVTKIQREVAISSKSYATGVWTVNLAANHYLATGDVVKLFDHYSGTTYDLAVTVLDGDSFSVALAEPRTNFSGSVFLDNFGTAVSGAQTPFTFSFNDGVLGLIHVVSNGTADATVKAEGSLDGVHWVDVAAAQAITNGNMTQIVIDKPWAYGRLNFTVAVAQADGGVNTVKAYRCGC